MLYKVELESIMLRAFVGGYDKNITYIIQPYESDQLWAVDASVPIEKIPLKLRNKISGILITHTHGDHVAYMDEYISENPELNLFIYKDSSFPRFSSHTRKISNGDVINLGHIQIKVLHTPGHYPDSCCFLLNDSLFTGDSVFIGRTGRTISYGSNVRTLYESVYKKILTLPQNIIIFPGHDYGPKPYCSINENIKISPLLQAKNEDDFVKRMEEYEQRRHS